MNLVNVSVRKLFGSLDHDIPLTPGGITFIHGPNGCGKTTVLKLLHALANRDFLLIRNVDFSEFLLKFSDDVSLVIERKVVSGSRQGSLLEGTADTRDFDLMIRLAGGKVAIDQQAQLSKLFGGSRRAYGSVSSATIERRLPFLSRLDADIWFDRRTGRQMSTSAVVFEYSELLGVDARPSLPKWLEVRIDSMAATFVRTQRLSAVAGGEAGAEYTERTRPRDFVEICSNRTRDLIARRLAEYSVQGQLKDRTFPRRFLEKRYPKVLSTEAFEEQYLATQRRVGELVEAGLLDSAEEIPLPKRAPNRTELAFLTLYLADYNDKLALLNDLKAKLEALVAIVGSKLRRKRLRVVRDAGLLVESSDTDARQIRLSDLSSGEQHQLVMFHDLLFAPSGVRLLLIDEPEISLHVEWQRAFVEDLQKVAGLTSATFLIATHSPQIIGARRDLAVALDGGLPG